MHAWWVHPVGEDCARGGGRFATLRGRRWRMRQPLANALDLDLRGGLTDKVTPHAGVALLIELGRHSGGIAAAAQALPATRSPKGLRPGELVEAVVLRSALGGDCLDDL